MKTVGDISVRQFIQEYLIDDIGNIVKTHPYFAFLLMAVGIEFLGRCQSTNTWNDSQNSKNYFDDGLAVPPLCQYAKKYPCLYHQLRCGLAHAYRPGGIMLSNKGGVGDISCDDFYADFIAACKNVLDDKAPKKVRNLDELFFAVTTTDDGTSTTATTTNNQVQQTK